ncbi:MAG TPA: NAD-dependent succinate-semialdehyde dehydrogenase [Desulfomonilia bacterium]
MEHYQVYLNGTWVDSPKRISVMNPATGEAFADIATVDRNQVRKALGDAEEAFPAWSGLPAIKRGDYLLAIAGELTSRTEKIARAITMENGKPLTQSKAEVAMTIDHFRWFAEEGRRAYGRWVPNQTDSKRHIIMKNPVGVVGAIAPWNFPLMLAARKVGPALAAGCPVILKPSSLTPVSAVELTRCVEMAGLPKGAFQLVVGNSSEIASEMLDNPICRKVSFTGSSAVGKLLIAGAAKTCTSLSLELGGNAPLIIFADADFDKAVEGAMTVKFRNTGQSCVAANRIYVERSVYSRFVEAFVKKVKVMKIGNGLEPGIDIGPIINEEGLQTALEFIDDALSKGARLVCGGKRLNVSGSFLEPAVLTDVPDTALCMNEEIFAPVAVFVPFDTEEEVLAKANSTEYGLAAYVYTSNLNRGLMMSERLQAGSIGLNDAVPATSNCPFGGFKQSGWGRELGIEGLDAYLETKHISIGGFC